MAETRLTNLSSKKPCINEHDIPVNSVVKISVSNNTDTRSGGYTCLYITNTLNHETAEIVSMKGIVDLYLRLNIPPGHSKRMQIDGITVSVIRSEYEENVL